MPALLSLLHVFRYAAPPVISPLGTSFPDNTSVQPPFLVKMPRATPL